MGFFSFFRKTTSQTPYQKQLAAYVTKLLGVKPNDVQFYVMALTHQSHADKHQLGYNYERLEFLGDAVLDMSVSEHLYNVYPEKNEGELTKLRSAIVNRKNLNRLAKAIKIAEQIRTEVDLKTPGISLPGNALEALIGAIYLDLGYNVSNEFILSKLLTVHSDLEQLEAEFENYKSTLLEWSQKHNKTINIEIESIPKGRGFEAKIEVDSEEKGRGKGRSKKIAEQEAALKVLEALGLR